MNQSSAPVEGISQVEQNPIPTPPARRKNVWWSWKIQTLEDAEKIVKETAHGLYFLAVLQGVILFLLFQQWPIDAAIYLLLAFFIRRKSRAAAIFLLVVSLIVLGTTFAAMAGVMEGGRNWYLAAILIWVAIKSIQATSFLSSVQRNAGTGSTSHKTVSSANQEAVNESSSPPSTWLGKKIEEEKNALQVRQAMRGRYPAWLALLKLGVLFVCIPLVGYLLFQVGKHLKMFVRPDVPYGIPMSDGYLVILLTSYVAALPLGLLLANGVFWIISPIRNRMNQLAEGVPGASFQDGMSSLGRVAMITVPIAMLLIAVFAFEPWTP